MPEKTPAELIEVAGDRRIIVGNVHVELAQNGTIKLTGETPWKLDFPDCEYELRPIKQ